MSRYGFRARQDIKQHSIAAPTINPFTVAYAGVAFNLTGSAYGSAYAGAFLNATWQISDAHGVVANAVTTTTTGTFTLPTSVVTPLHAIVRYQSAAGIVSPWSPALPVAFEYGPPYAPAEITQLYAVSLSTFWSNWMNDHAVWVGPPGDTSLLIGQYVSVEFSITVTIAGVYSFQNETDDSMQLAVDGVIVIPFVQDLSDRNILPNVTNYALTAGQHTLAITGYNAPGGTTWQTNPGGFCLVILDPNGTMIFNLRDKVGQTSYYCANGGTYSASDGACHLYSPAQS